MNTNNNNTNNYVHPYMMQQQQQQQYTKTPDAPVQYHSGLAQQQQDANIQYPTLNVPQQQQQTPVFTTSSPYPTTTTTYTTTIEQITPQPLPVDNNVAQASMEDSSLKLVGSSIAKQMWTKLKSRVRSPYTLVSSLCNMLSLAMLFEFIFIIVASCQTYRYSTPAHMHIVFWILFVVQPIFMILKSPLLMVISLLMNLALFVMSCVQTAAYGKLTGISYGVLVVMFLYSCFFSLILAVSYLKKVNKTPEQTQSPKAAIMADIITITQNIKRYREMIKACKVSDLLIGAE